MLLGFFWLREKINKEEFFEADGLRQLLNKDFYHASPGTLNFPQSVVVIAN